MLSLGYKDIVDMYYAHRDKLLSDLSVDGYDYCRTTLSALRELDRFVRDIIPDRDLWPIVLRNDDYLDHDIQSALFKYELRQED